MLGVQEVAGRLRLEVRVQPRSSRNQIAGIQEGALKIKLTAPPVDGEANKALVEFIADFFNLPKKNVALLRGESTRIKLIEISGISRAELMQKVAASQ